MNWISRTLLLLALTALPAISRVHGQEALEIKGDQDSSTTSERPAPPAESDTEEEAKPTKKAKGPAKSVEEMNPEEFKRMGLDKLSPDELKTLNEWLKGYRRAAETKAAAQATEQTREQVKEEARAEAKKEFGRNWLTTDKIYSRIQGEFHGLGKGGKKILIVLEDGTVWKQANEQDRVLDPPKLIQDPPVMVTHSFTGYKMHVIGAGEFWVNPVRPK